MQSFLETSESLPQAALGVGSAMEEAAGSKEPLTASERAFVDCNDLPEEIWTLILGPSDFTVLFFRRCATSLSKRISCPKGSLFLYFVVLPALLSVSLYVIPVRPLAPRSYKNRI